MNNPQNKVFSLRAILEKDKLNGSNFLDWYRNLRIVLRQEKKDYVLERVLPEKLPSNASHAVRETWHKHYDDVVDVRCLMLANMSSDLQKQFENVESPREMITNLKSMFQVQARIERYQTVKSLFACKLPQGGSVGSHVRRIMCYLDNMARLDSPISQELATDIILQSLPSSYDIFVKSYYANDLTRPLTELHGMLKTFELDIKERAEKAGKDQSKGKTDLISNRDKSRPFAKSKANSPNVDKCHYCLVSGHWKRDCKKFLEDLKELEKMYDISPSGPKQQ